MRPCESGRPFASRSARPRVRPDRSEPDDGARRRHLAGRPRRRARLRPRPRPDLVLRLPSIAVARPPPAGPSDMAVPLSRSSPGHLGTSLRLDGGHPIGAPTCARSGGPGPVRRPWPALTSVSHWHRSGWEMAAPCSARGQQAVLTPFGFPADRRDHRPLVRGSTACPARLLDAQPSARPASRHPRVRRSRCRRSASKWPPSRCRWPCGQSRTVASRVGRRVGTKDDGGARGGEGCGTGLKTPGARAA